MNKRELYNSIVELFYYNDYKIDRHYDIGEYGFRIIGDTIKLTIVTDSDFSFFRGILSKNGTSSPRIDELGYEASLEMLFHQYPYGYTNGSNCVLINASGDIIAISYNGCADTCVLINSSLGQQDYIIINNSKRLEYKLKYKDFKEIEEWLRTNFTS